MHKIFVEGPGLYEVAINRFGRIVRTDRLFIEDLIKDKDNPIEIYFEYDDCNINRNLIFYKNDSRIIKSKILDDFVYSVDTLCMNPICVVNEYEDKIIFELPRLKFMDNYLGCNDDITKLNYFGTKLFSMDEEKYTVHYISEVATGHKILEDPLYIDVRLMRFISEYVNYITTDHYSETRVCPNCFSSSIDNSYPLFKCMGSHRLTARLADISKSYTIHKDKMFNGNSENDVVICPDCSTENCIGDYITIDTPILPEIQRIYNLHEDYLTTEFCCAGHNLHDFGFYVVFTNNIRLKNAITKIFIEDRDNVNEYFRMDKDPIEGRYSSEDEALLISKIIVRANDEMVYKLAKDHESFDEIQTIILSKFDSLITLIVDEVKNHIEETNK